MTKWGIFQRSQGYIFAANLDNPGLTETFNAALTKPMTNAALENKLASFKKVTRNLSGMENQTLRQVLPESKLYQDFRHKKYDDHFSRQYGFWRWGAHFNL
jgi:hypothetical protein